MSPVAFIPLWLVSPIAAVGTLMLSHALLLYPTLRPNAQGLGPVVTSFETSGRELWLTIDDGPSDDTEALLDLFEREGVRATFFVKGELVRRRPGMIAEIIRRGHAVGNHSHTHPSATFWCLPPGRIAREIDLCSDAISQSAAVESRLFRAPVGMKNPFVHPLLEKRGMRLIGWSVRGFDTVMTDERRVVASLLRKLRPGAIVLTHEAHARAVRLHEMLIAGARERGYSFVIPRGEQLRAG